MVARGPKPAAVLREMRVTPARNVPEPNTWRELLAATTDRPERRIAVQEYGKQRRPAGWLAKARSRGDPGPCLPIGSAGRHGSASRCRPPAGGRRVRRRPIHDICSVGHLFRIASELGIEARVHDAFERVMVASIGPTTTETLEDLASTLT